MINFDRFVDTASKRKALFLNFAFIFGMYISYTYLKTAGVLLTISNYDNIFSILKEGSLTSCYFARILLDCISMPNFEIMAFIKVLVVNIQGIDVLFLLTIAIWLSDSSLKKHRHIVYKLFIMFLFQIIIITIIALYSTNAASLMEVVQNLYYIAYILIGFNSLMVLLYVYYGFSFMKQYRKAMQFEAIEILDEDPIQEIISSKGFTLRTLTVQDIPVFKEWLYKEHVSRWVEQPENWIKEAENIDGEFNFLRQYIADYDGKPFGFCQYYEYRYSGEHWHGTIPIHGTYSIDYMVGEPAYLRKGLGKAIIQFLIDSISVLPESKRIIVQPDKHNKASCNTLLSMGFSYDTVNELYVLEL